MYGDYTLMNQLGSYNSSANSGMGRWSVRVRRHGSTSGSYQVYATCLMGADESNVSVVDSAAVTMAPNGGYGHVAAICSGGGTPLGGGYVVWGGTRTRSTFWSRLLGYRWMHGTFQRAIPVAVTHTSRRRQSATPTAASSIARQQPRVQPSALAQLNRSMPLAHPVAGQPQEGSSVRRTSPCTGASGCRIVDGTPRRATTRAVAAGSSRASCV